MAPAQAVHTLSEAEYLAIERSAPTKSEYLDGEMFALADGTPEHSQIAANVLRAIGNRLETRPCVVYNADLRIKLRQQDYLPIPTSQSSGSGLQLAEGTEDSVVNPLLLVEVLSDTTEGYDRGTKFQHYRQIPSLREYLLVSQQEPWIDHYFRQADGNWLLREASGLESSLKLPSLEISLPLREVFSKVQFVRARIRPSSPPR